MIAAEVLKVAGGLKPVILEAVDACVEIAFAKLPPGRPGDAADPAVVADLLRADMVENVKEAVTASVAAIEIPPALVDEEALARAAALAVAAIAPPKDGRDADPEVIRQMVAEQLAAQIAQLPAPKDGVTPSVEELSALVEEAVVRKIKALPPAEPGKDADLNVVRQFIREEVAALPKAKDGETPSADLIRDLATPILADLVAALPLPERGRDADPAEMQRMIDEAVSRVPPAKDGEPPSEEVVRGIVEDVVSRKFNDLPPPADGKDADPEVIRQMVMEAFASIPPPKDGLPGKDGRLPVVKAWEDRVYYAGEVATFDGATYQASTDTGRPPPHDDWMCIAARGGAGETGKSFAICGTFDATRSYDHLSVVALGGASFVAKRDNPGPCPGDGWQLLAQQGKRGLPLKGDPGPAARAMFIDDSGMLTLINADGSEVQCDLYPILSKL
jgi:hypothetical protein